MLEPPCWRRVPVRRAARPRRPAGLGMILAVLLLALVSVLMVAHLLLTTEAQSQVADIVRWTQLYYLCEGTAQIGVLQWQFVSSGVGDIAPSALRAWRVWKPDGRTECRLGYRNTPGTRWENNLTITASCETAGALAERKAARLQFWKKRPQTEVEYDASTRGSAQNMRGYGNMPYWRVAFNIQPFFYDWQGGNNFGPADQRADRPPRVACPEPPDLALREADRTMFERLGYNLGQKTDYLEFESPGNTGADVFEQTTCGTNPGKRVALRPPGSTSADWGFNYRCLECYFTIPGSTDPKDRLSFSVDAMSSNEKAHDICYRLARDVIRSPIVDDPRHVLKWTPIRCDFMGKKEYLTYRRSDPRARQVGKDLVFLNTGE